MPSIKARPVGGTTQRARPLALDNLRTFATVARTLSFRAAADELHLTQSAVSRRVQALEDDLGLPLFARDTRKVEPTLAGEALLQAVTPALDRIDRTVARLRADQSRRHVSVTTFGTFATLWLLPRLEDFQRAHPDIDIRIEASDKLTDMHDPELDVALRYAVFAPVPAHAERMFGEVIAPVASPMLVAAARAGRTSALASTADLARHTFFDQDEEHPGSRCSTWRYWLHAQGQADVAPRRRVTVNYGHQGIQAAMAGQGLAIGRLGLIHDTLARGELVEVFGPKARVAVPAAYWMVPMLNAVLRPELARFLAWVRDQAAATRQAIGEADEARPAPAATRKRRPADAPRASR